MSAVLEWVPEPGAWASPGNLGACRPSEARPAMCVYQALGVGDGAADRTSALGSEAGVGPLQPAVRLTVEALAKFPSPVPYQALRPGIPDVIEEYKSETK